LWKEEIKPKTINVANKCLIIDGFFLRRKCVVLIARTLENIIYWKFYDKENYLN